jgi:hypothetical protein
LEATTFLKGKRVLEKMEEYNVIRVFCSIEKPTFLSYYISDKMFIIEIARQYKLWFHTFFEKRKKQFIPLPWKFGEIILQGISKIDEYVAYFDHSDLRFMEEIKGFYPIHLFYNHFLSVGLNNYNYNNQEADRDSGYIKIVISTTEHHKERGKPSSDKNVQSSVVSRRSSLPKENP